MRPAFPKANQYSGRLLPVALATVVAISGLGLSGCKHNPFADMFANFETVATVNGEKITKAEYNETYREISRMFRLDENPEAKDNPFIEQMIKQQTLNKLILDKLLAQKAKDLDVKVSRDDMQKFTAEQIKQAGGEEAFQQLLKQNNVTMDDFRDAAYDKLLLDKVTEKMVGTDKLAISDAEAKAFYQENKQRFHMPKNITSSHILIKAVEPELKKQLREENANLSEEELDKRVAEQRKTMRAKAEDLYKRLKDDPSQFNAFAKKYSEDTLTAAKGGQLDPLMEGGADPAFWNAINTTATGKLHDGVVETMFGYHVVRVDKITDAHQLSYDEAKDDIKTLMKEQRKQEAFQKWLTEARQNVDLEIKPEYRPATEEGGVMGGAAPQQQQQQPPPDGAKATQQAPAKH